MKRSLILLASSVCLGAMFAMNGSQNISKGLLLVANKGDRTLGLVDPVSGKMIATVPEDGVTGHEVVASPDGTRAFVPIYGNAGVGSPGTDGQLIRVVDLATHQVSGTIDLGRGLRPHCAVIGPKNGLLYVTTELGNCITVIDPQTLKVIGSIPTGEAESHMLAISSDGRRGYTANVASGTVSVLDLEAQKVLTVIPICPKTQRISISTDDRWVFTSDQTKPQLAVIDTTTNGVSAWITLPGLGYGSAVTPNGRNLLLAIPRANVVAVIDLSLMKVVETITVPHAPQEVLVRPDGLEAYVSCDASHQIAVIDPKTWKVKSLIEAGSGVDGLAWAKGK